MENNATDISVVIVSYKCLDVLRMSLDTLRLSMEGLSCDVYVVDNASEDGTVAFLREHYGWVTVIDNHENVGFSQANNIALAQCRGRVVLILNPDTIVPRIFFKEIVGHFATYPRSGAVGVQMTNGRGVFLKESKRGYPDIKTSLFKLTGLWRLFPSSPFFNNYYVGQHPKTSVCKAPVLSGACMAFLHTTMDEVGVFDPSYFMYGEDIDLSWRMNEASEDGNYYRGDLNMIHFKGISTPRRMKYIYSFYDAMILFARKYENPKHNVVTNALVALGVRAGFLVAAVKCVLLRAIERKQKPATISRVAFASCNKEHQIDFAGRMTGGQVDVVDANDISALDASIYDAVVFDIDEDIEAFIEYMKRQSNRSLFGFYSSVSGMSFVYEGNGCRMLFK
ncbi:MAG: glycosyltransferase family 2 protein [Bacteroidales bacterium]|nr:glycosyltransferase family 2 protein [Bacteroidales bacterium]